MNLHDALKLAREIEGKAHKAPWELTETPSRSLFIIPALGGDCETICKVTQGVDGKETGQFIILARNLFPHLLTLVECLELENDRLRMALTGKAEIDSNFNMMPAGGADYMAMPVHKGSLKQAQGAGMDTDLARTALIAAIAETRKV